MEKRSVTPACPPFSPPFSPARKDDKGKQEPGLVTRSNERKEIFTGKEPE